MVVPAEALIMWDVTVKVIEDFASPHDLRNVSENILCFPQSLVELISIINNEEHFSLLSPLF